MFQVCDQAFCSYNFEAEGPRGLRALDEGAAAELTFLAQVSESVSEILGGFSRLN